MENNKYEGFESFEAEKIGLAAKLFKRVLANKHYQATVDKSAKLFSDLLQHSKPFRKAIDELAGSEFFVSDILQNLDWKRMTDKAELGKLRLLTDLIGRLRIRYEMEFVLKKFDDISVRGQEGNCLRDRLLCRGKETPGDNRSAIGGSTEEAGREEGPGKERVGSVCRGNEEDHI
jgi:hypothetical protein